MERQRLISQQKQQRPEKTASPIPDLDLKRLISSKVMSFPHNPHPTRRVTAYQSAGPPRRRHFPARAHKVQHSTPEGQPPPVFARTCAPLSRTPWDLPRPHPPLSME